MANRPPRLSVGLIVKALESQIAALQEKKEGDNLCESLWQVRQLEEQIEALNYRPTQADTAGWGGNWLGVLRSWVQFNFRNGSDVTWGGHETLHGSPMTSAKLEQLAAQIASEAVKEHMGLPSKDPRKTTF